MHCCISYVLQAHTYMNYKLGLRSFQITQSYIYLQFPFAVFNSIYIVAFCVFANSGRQSVLLPLWNLFFDSYFDVFMLNVFYEYKITQVEEYL
jgi:hypothetical protein